MVSTVLINHTTLRQFIQYERGILPQCYFLYTVHTSTILKLLTDQLKFHYSHLSCKETLMTHWDLPFLHSSMLFRPSICNNTSVTDMLHSHKYRLFYTSMDKSTGPFTH